MQVTTPHDLESDHLYRFKSVNTTIRYGAVVLSVMINRITACLSNSNIHVNMTEIRNRLQTYKNSVRSNNKQEVCYATNFCTILYLHVELLYII